MSKNTVSQTSRVRTHHLQTASAELSLESCGGLRASHTWQRFLSLDEPSLTSSECCTGPSSHQVRDISNRPQKQHSANTQIANYNVHCRIFAGNTVFKHQKLQTKNADIYKTELSKNNIPTYQITYHVYICFGSELQRTSVQYSSAVKYHKHTQPTVFFDNFRLFPMTMKFIHHDGRTCTKI